MPKSRDELEKELLEMNEYEVRMIADRDALNEDLAGISRDIRHLRKRIEEAKK